MSGYAQSRGGGLRSERHWRAHVNVRGDLTDTGRRRFGHPPQRFDYARAVANLKQMDVAIQAYDFIFAGNMEAESDQALADEDRDEMELLGELLTGHIVIVADLASGSGDLGVTPIGGEFPLSRLHSNAIHTMLTGDFIRRASTGGRLASELGLLGLVLVLAVTCRPFPFVLGSLAAGLGYAILVAVCFSERACFLIRFDRD
jgi:hypothetical protein